MNRNEARALLGNQPRWALSNMARALQMLTRLNTSDDWRQLEALRALGYKVTCEIPGREEQADKARRVQAFRLRLAGEA